MKPCEFAWYELAFSLLELSSVPGCDTSPVRVLCPLSCGGREWDGRILPEAFKVEIYLPPKERGGRLRELPTQYVSPNEPVRPSHLREILSAIQSWIAHLDKTDPATADELRNWLRLNLPATLERYEHNKETGEISAMVALPGGLPVTIEGMNAATLVALVELERATAPEIACRVTKLLGLDRRPVVAHQVTAFMTRLTKTDLAPWIERPGKRGAKGYRAYIRDGRVGR